MRIKPPYLLNLFPRLTPYQVMVNAFRFFLVIIAIACLFEQWINPPNDRSNNPLPSGYGIWVSSIHLVAWISILICVGAMSLMFIRMISPIQVTESENLEQRDFHEADARFDSSDGHRLRITD
ncbi:hypothetical protein [Planctopirus hydrillae]|nr:hypothetical protein [Planctopirus hydrillae]